MTALAERMVVPFRRWRALWRRGARALADQLPKGLYARSLLIVVLPIALLQVAVVYLFMLRHWERVAERLSATVARDVGAIVDLFDDPDALALEPRLRAIAEMRFRMTVDLMPPGPLPPTPRTSVFDLLDPLSRVLPDELRQQIRAPFWVDTTGTGGILEIRVAAAQGVLRIFLPRTLAYEPNAHIFILWMLGASILLVTVAIMFLRNQIRPILALAEAAENFGKGREMDFRPRGASEVRRAGHAFIEMKRRVERSSEQRTALLNGVSHDLRTLLTRFRLSLALLEPSAEVENLKKDVDEMSSMLESYLAFARGDISEPTALVDLKALLAEIKSEAERHGSRVALSADGDLAARVRPLAMKRCVSNLVANAQRYAQAVVMSAEREARWVTILVDDDGPGIPPESREDVFRPFFRLDEARNQDEGGAGLGLSISREIARAHGGDVTLGASPMGGLRASVRVPV